MRKINILLLSIIISVMINFHLVVKYSVRYHVEYKLKWKLQIKNTMYQFAEDIRIADIDGDKLADIVVMGSWSVIGVRGKDGRVVLDITPKNFSGIPEFLWIDDINNDGIQEIILTLTNGLVIAYNVRDEILWSFNVSEMQLNESLNIINPEVVFTGDINGDGKKEIVISVFMVSAKSENFHGIVILNNDGSLYKVLLSIKEQEDIYVSYPDLILLGVTDVNNDGVDELLVYYHRFIAINDRGNVIIEFMPPMPCFYSYVLCDVNNDKILDFIALDTTIENNYVACTDGQTGKQLWSINFDSDLHLSPFLLVTSDIDNDENPEILFAGTLIKDYENYKIRNILFALNAKDGSLLWTADLGGIRCPAGIITADLNGDNCLDVIIWNNSWIFAYDGKTGFKIFRLHIEKTWNTLVAAADVDGDFAVEVIVTTWNHINVYDIPSAGFRAFWWFYSDKLVMDDIAISSTLFDHDGDGLSDISEMTIGTDPFTTDTDNDGFSDLYEVLSGSNPLAPTTDDDFDLWPNSIDPRPGDFFIPNLWLCLIVAILIMIKEFPIEMELKQTK